MDVDLILLSQSSEPPKPFWPLGQVYVLKPDVQVLNTFTAQYLATTQAEAWLFWDVELGQPDAAVVQKALSGTADVWHAGLALGMRGLPGMIDFVSPTWMLNCDPAPEIEATSWRVSLRACLVRTEVLRQLGFISPGFESMEAAGLEWGHRCIRRGVLVRHTPCLLGDSLIFSRTTLPFVDELRFLLCGYGRIWTLWAMLRAIFVGYTSLVCAIRAWGRLNLPPMPFVHLPFDQSQLKDMPVLDSKDREAARVSVLIPTVDRYPYLHTLLSQLREQTICPLEIIVVDQTPHEQRHQAPYDNFRDLSLRIIYQDKAGQCSSRNAGLVAASGNHILLLDDDEEIQPDFIEAHLVNLKRFDTIVSSGVVEELGGGALPEAFTFTRISDVFPAGNTLFHRSLMERTGLFDLAYEHGARADGDMGMRAYLSGAMMILNPSIRILHHHAPRGGLRKHKARVITYAGSRKSILQRHLPSATEIYLAGRYFSSVQLREMLYIRVLGTFSVNGNTLKQILKILVSTVLLPETLWIVFARRRKAMQMLHHFPDIPDYFQVKDYASHNYSKQ